MKTIFLLLVLFGISTSTLCQDIIFNKQHEKIEANVIEVTPDLIKYKRFDNPQGPVYTIMKSDVVRIEYKNGTTDEFSNRGNRQDLNEPLSYRNGFWGLVILQGQQKLSSQNIKELYKTDKEALSLYNSGKSMNTVGLVIGIPSSLVFGWELGNVLAGGDVNTAAMILGGTGFVTSIIIGAVGDSKIKKSIQIYNSNNERSVGHSLNFGLTNIGVGLCFKF